MALRIGSRGLRPGSSLARLLARRRGVRNVHDLPPLSVQQVLRWADEFHRRHEAWPHRNSGPIAKAGGETWFEIAAPFATAGEACHATVPWHAFFAGHVAYRISTIALRWSSSRS